MKNYIIALENYPLSVSMAQVALESALKYNWDAEIWFGIDGSQVSYEQLQKQYHLSSCSWDKKCSKMIQSRPGVRGCFLSHYLLWQYSRDNNETIGIFEHDIIFKKSAELPTDFCDVLKLEGFNIQAPRSAGRWYEGARAYIIKPEGATKLIDWVRYNGCLPTDVCIGSEVVKIELLDQELIELQLIHNDKQDKHTNSFTWNLEGMVKRTV
jgi:GR25 family glycosyltransferase involved in LPS biosynthesis